MPASNAHPSSSIRMVEAARAGMMVTLICGLCRRSVHYWAADLVQVVGPMHRSAVPPWPCSRCKSMHSMSVRVEVPSLYDMADGKIIVRRPVKQIVKWIWRNEKA